MDRQHLPALDQEMVESTTAQIRLPLGPPRNSHAGRRKLKKNWQVYGNLSKRTATRFKRKNRPLITYIANDKICQRPRFCCFLATKSSILNLLNQTIFPH